MYDTSNMHTQQLSSAFPSPPSACCTSLPLSGWIPTESCVFCVLYTPMALSIQMNSMGCTLFWLINFGNVKIKTKYYMLRMSRFIYKFTERIQIWKEEIVRKGKLEVDISLSYKKTCKPIHLRVNYNIWSTFVENKYLIFSQILLIWNIVKTVDI